MIDQARACLQERTYLRPQIGVILGSGLGAFAQELTEAVSIPYAEIPGFPQSTAVGHPGRLIIGNLGQIPVAVMAGRVHLYEGYTAAQAAFGVRALGQFGVRTLIITNAAGGIGTHLQQGSLVLISDHINLQGQSPLTGPNDDTLGPRFPDMTEAYSQKLRSLAQQAAQAMGLHLHEGVYAALPGPSYETPAEIRYLRTIGADLVGMSTVPEVIAANHMGLEVLGISCVTNLASGLSGKKLDHAEVLETGNQTRSLPSPTPVRSRSAGPWPVLSHMTPADLIEAATKARENAVAPYSQFKVGAALEDAEGKIHTGCNVENSTYGLTVCAERIAIFKALSEGARTFRRIAVVTDTPKLAPPCGACRQILWEFMGDTEVILANLTGQTETWQLATLFPRAFDASFL